MKTYSNTKSWKKLKLTDCCKIVSGATPSRNNPEFWGGDILWVTPKDLSDLDETTLYDTPEKITEKGLKNCSANLLPEGSILFSSRAPIGHIAIVGKSMCTNQGFKSLIPSSDVDSKYLYWTLKHVTPIIKSKGRGATFKEVSKEIMASVEIPLPPLSQQCRIAAILDKTNVIRRKRAATIKLLDDFLRSVFLDMFGDPVRNEKGWKTSSLGDALEFVTSGSRGWARYYANSGDKFLRIQNVGHNELKLDDMTYVKTPSTAEAKRTRVKAGDVLFSITADLGRTAVVPGAIGTAYINQHLALLRVKDIVPEFVSAYFATPGGRAQVQQATKGGVKAGLNFDDINGLKIYLPPQELQKKYKTIESKIRGTKNNLEKNLVEKELFSAALTQHAFRGEL